MLFDYRFNRRGDMAVLNPPTLNKRYTATQFDYKIPWTTVRKHSSSKCT